MTPHTTITHTTIDLAAAEAAALRLAADCEYHHAPKSAAYWRHVAYDAACAADSEYPCEASLASVLETFNEDDALADEMAKENVT